MEEMNLEMQCETGIQTALEPEGTARALVLLKEEVITHELILLKVALRNIYISHPVVL